MGRRRQRSREDESPLAFMMTAALQSAWAGFILAAIALVVALVLRAQETTSAPLARLFGTICFVVSGVVALITVVGLVVRRSAALLRASNPIVARFARPRAPAQAPERREAPEQRRTSMLSRGEMAFYDPLRHVVAGRYEIHVKPSLADVVECRGHPQFAAVAAMHVDFLLCDRETLRPRLAIELDDDSHADSRRAAADRRKDELLRGAGIPLLRQRCCAAYDVQELRERIDRAMG